MAKVTGTEGLDIAARGAGGGPSGFAVGGSEERVVESPWEGVVEGIVGDGGGDFADGALSDFVVGVDSELDGRDGVTDYGVVEVGHFIILLCVIFVALHVFWVDALLIVDADFYNLMIAMNYTVFYLYHYAAADNNILIVHGCSWSSNNDVMEENL